jgi:hypothetical protein
MKDNSKFLGKTLYIIFARDEKDSGPLIANDDESVRLNVTLGSILQNFISAESFSDQFILKFFHPKSSQII